MDKEFLTKVVNRFTPEELMQIFEIANLSVTAHGDEFWADELDDSTVPETAKKLDAFLNE